MKNISLGQLIVLILFFIFLFSDVSKFFKKFLRKSYDFFKKFLKKK